MKTLSIISLVGIMAMLSSLGVTTAVAETNYIHCVSESQDMRTYCPLPDNVSHVFLAERFSSAPCDYGVSWGLKGAFVWTAFGCAAEFAAEENLDVLLPMEADEHKPYGYVNGVFRREA